ncbi:hypothetical protein C8R43DRAFT_1241009 [Mycena crocata]|nr:hypothetical protein C8R43DRAFT_1241009 [Mycena crocata]
MTPSIDATYGVWLVSLVLETMSLFPLCQLRSSLTWTEQIVRRRDASGLDVFFRQSHRSSFDQVDRLNRRRVGNRPSDLFSVSSYSRFVKLFGKPQTNLVWADSLQLLCAYLSAFLVQVYSFSSNLRRHTTDLLEPSFFANRIIKLTKGRGKFSLKAFGIYVILALAFIEILAGITQLSDPIVPQAGPDQGRHNHSIGASLACDVLITTYLCLFLKNQKGEMMKTNNMVDALIYDAINRGTITAMSSFVTMVLVTIPGAARHVWFFLGLAPSSKLYMNSMLATLNTRQRIRNKIDAGDKGWNSIGNSIPLSTLQIGNKNASGQSQSIPSIAAVDLETGSVDMCRKREEYPASAV